MIDVLLLLALPASGKSELRRYLDVNEQASRDLGLGPTVQLDDFPYVHLMRRISDVALSLGLSPPFFDGSGPFIDRRDWGTLIHLLNDDFEMLSSPPRPGGSAGRWMTDRLASARTRAGVEPWFPGLTEEVRKAIESTISEEAGEMLEAAAGRHISVGDTVVVEFARGGPVGGECPLPAPRGYQYALSLLARPILERAAVLYVWVTPEESRKKNRERSLPGAEGSILHHGVPEEVMAADYGVDDFHWMLTTSGRPGTVRVEADSRVYYLPAAVFDNRSDFTSFLRAEPADWEPSKVEALHERLAETFARLNA